jgi:hypothetical protein
MEINLKFKITLVNGEETTQEIKVQADPKLPVEKQTLFLMQQMFNQYAQVGLLREPQKGKFILRCPSQLAFVECEMPSILLASSIELPKSAQLE